MGVPKLYGYYYPRGCQSSPNEGKSGAVARWFAGLTSTIYMPILVTISRTLTAAEGGERSNFPCMVAPRKVRDNRAYSAKGVTPRTVRREVL